MRKILYSPGYGAGWTSWNTSNPDVEKYMLTYAPIISFLENGGKFKDSEDSHQLLVQLREECKNKFGEDYVCTLGAGQLKVKSVSGRVRINEYDGFESVEEEGEYSGWI